MDYQSFSILAGKTLTGVERVGDDELIFTAHDGKWKLLHIQDCCESVTIEDVCGDLDSLVGVPIIYADEASNEGDWKYGHETWTFYRIGTTKGHVTIRWYGESNGCYSEGVDFVKVE